MKNIFKTANSKLFLLLLITFLSNLSYGQQRTYEQRLKDLYPGDYLVSKQNELRPGMTEYREYDQYGDVYYYMVDWNKQEVKQTISYEDYYGSSIAINSAIDAAMSANENAGQYLASLDDAINGRQSYVSMEDAVAGIMSDFAYYDDPFFNQKGMEDNVLSSFINAAFNNTSGQNIFKLTVDGTGNSFVGGTGVDVVNGVYTSNGQYVDYANNKDLVDKLFKTLSSGQKEYLYDQANYLSYTANAWLNQVYVNKATNFDKDQFIADVIQGVFDSQEQNGLTPPPFTIGDSGDYGWNDGSAERLWQEHMPFTSSFSTWLNGVKTGDKSQMALGAGLLLLDAASFGEGGSLIKLLPLGLGTTGRTIATNLVEEMAMEAVVKNPRIGTIIMEGMSDSRWLGWSKMEYKVKTAEGVNAIIHYVGKWENGILKAVDDFKFK